MLGEVIFLPTYLPTYLGIQDILLKVNRFKGKCEVYGKALPRDCNFSFPLNLSGIEVLGTPVGNDDYPCFNVLRGKSRA